MRPRIEYLRTVLKPERSSSSRGGEGAADARMLLPLLEATELCAAIEDAGAGVALFFKELFLDCMSE